ncbi:MAG: zinc ribbon domain-containing protein [Nitrospira sp.]|nr:zinc ribbon domain-containing protein [Nitrospira sp.]
MTTSKSSHRFSVPMDDQSGIRPTNAIRGGMQQQRKRPEKDWLQVPMPEPQIISEGEWKAAHGRFDVTQTAYLRGTKGDLWGWPASNLDSKYLLTGLAQCGGSLYVRSSSRKGARVLFYGCMTYHVRGRTACSNNVLTPMDQANEEVLSVLERQVLHPDIT